MDKFSIDEMRAVANVLNFATAPVRDAEIARAEVQFGRHVVAYIGQDRPWGSMGRVAIQRFRLDAPCVYFVGGDVGAIKIGMTIAPLERLAAFQFNSPIDLRILAMTAGGTKEEKAYHRQFAAHRLHGEWFSPAPDILAEIERLSA